MLRPTNMQLTPNRPGYQRTDRLDEVCYRHVRPVQQKLNDPQKSINKITVPQDQV